MLINTYYPYSLGFEPEVGKFSFFVLTVALLASTASALAFAISARAPVTAVATVGMIVSFIVQLVCTYLWYIQMYAYAKIWYL